MIPVGELRFLIEENYGALPCFLMYTLLEWVVIILLFIDGLLAFLTNEIARFFELKTPCLLCTRLDHALAQRDSNFYYNESICQVHKGDISNLAYCHVHKRLSDINTMCRGCLVPFSSDKDSDSDAKMIKLHFKPSRKDGMEIVFNRCSCCGEPMKLKSKSKENRSLSIRVRASSPRSPSFSGRNNEEGNLLPSRYTELKLRSVTDSELREEEDLHTYEEMNEEYVPRTPTFTSRNRFFGIPLTDSPPLSPKSPTTIDMGEELKTQETNLDQTSLTDLYTELDKERNASAVAANNAMTMITRLQAEKAAVQMEASQYQRMMEEQAEYDDEALQMMKETLLEREDELQLLEDELSMYRERYGVIKQIGSEICEVDLDDDYQDMKSSKSGSGGDDNEVLIEGGGGIQDELELDYEDERSKLLSLMRELEKKMRSSSTPTSPKLLEGSGGNEEDKAILAREVSLIRERLRGIEAESDFLKQAAMTLQKGGEGIRVLNEIAQHLRKLRQNSKSRSDDEEA